MPQQKIPFRAATRKRRQFLTSITYTGTAAQQRPAPINLPSTGFLSRILLVARGGIDLSGAGALAVDGLAGLYQQIVVSANLGSSNLFQASGAGADVAARMHGSFAPVAQPFDVTDTSASAFFYALPINIAANQKKQFALGLINLQDPQIQVQLALTFNPLTSVVTTATSGGTTSIQIDVWMEYFEVPDPRVAFLPPNVVVRTLEDQFPTAVVVGPNIYTVPRLGVMTDLACIAYANSVRMANASLSEMAIRFNKTDFIETRNGILQPVLDSTAMGVSPGAVPGALPVTGLLIASGSLNNVQPGVFNWRGWNATDVPDNGDFRDSIDTLELTTTEVIMTVAAGTTVVATDIIRAVRRVVQALV